jgi:hypothetical protein
MSHVIWKSRLTTNPVQEVELPFGAKVFAVQLQDNKPCIWYACDPEASFVVRTFLMIGTGQQVEDLEGATQLTYIGTYQQGPHVWHLFEDLSKDHRG